MDNGRSYNPSSRKVFQVAIYKSFDYLDNVPHFLLFLFNFPTSQSPDCGCWLDTINILQSSGWRWRRDSSPLDLWYCEDQFVTGLFGIDHLEIKPGLPSPENTGLLLNQLSDPAPVPALSLWEKQENKKYKNFYYQTQLRLGSWGEVEKEVHEMI